MTPNLVGERFSRLTVIADDGSARITCRCDCGTEKLFRRKDVVKNCSKSCGCLAREVSARSAKANLVPHAKTGRLTHGHSVGGQTSSEYTIWRSMLARCRNPRVKVYPYYGGRGITVCERWSAFENFIADMGHKPSPSYQIDRIDNAGNYSPENCRWATRVEQGRNRRDNRLLSLNGETLPLSQWAQRLGVRHGVIHKRLALGWPIEKALTTPAAHRTAHA